MIDVLQDGREEHFDIIKHNELGVYFCGYDAAELEQILTKMKALQDTACNMQGEKV